VLSWSDVRKASKKRKHLNRYFTLLNKLSSRSLEETNTSATAEDNTTAANDKRLNIKVVIISQNHCYRNQMSEQEVC
jgi:hypothetical protein